jgi:hypothetical protein
MLKKPRISPMSDYPECYKCPADATEDCPALYRVTEHCPYHDNIIKKKERETNV